MVKKKKGGGLKVKIQFTSVFKEIKEMSSASKESTPTDVSSSETVANTTLQTPPIESASSPDLHPTTMEPAKSISCHLSSLTRSSSGTSPPLQGDQNYPHS